MTQDLVILIYLFTFNRILLFLVNVCWKQIEYFVASIDVMGSCKNNMYTHHVLNLHLTVVDFGLIFITKLNFAFYEEVTIITGHFKISQ